MTENDVLFSNETSILGKNPGASIRSRTKTFYQESNLGPSISSSDALPLSYGRLVGAKAIKLRSWDKHPAYC